MTAETLTPVPGAEPTYDDDGRELVRVATCGTCGRSWNDAALSSLTPAPAGRCPFEDDHELEPGAEPELELVTIELEACDPEELPVPTSAVRWWVTSTGLSCLVRIQGKRGDVRAFVADQWSEEIAYGGPDDDPHTYDVATAYAVEEG